MILTWYPDVCRGGQCVIRQNPADLETPELVITLCPLHMGMKFNNALDDAETYRRMRVNMRLRERARAVAKTELALDKEFPGLPYTIAADGSFTILLGNYTKNADGSFTRSGNVSNQTRTRIQSALTTALGVIEQSPGIVSVSVANG